MFSDVFSFKVQEIRGEPTFVCTIISQSNELHIFSGNTMEEIYQKCVNKFPHGIKPRGIFFTGDDYFRAKSNFCSLISYGLRMNYFKESDFINYDDDIDRENMI
jgi:hypothetical protein